MLFEQRRKKKESGGSGKAEPDIAPTGCWPEEVDHYGLKCHEESEAAGREIARLLPRDAAVHLIGDLGAVKTFLARVIATVLPAVENYNVEAAIVTRSIVPASYVGFTSLYSAAYVAAAVLLAFILFEDRDLA